MSFETTVSIPALKDEFTISATCESCANQAMAHIRDIEEVVEFAGTSAALHSIRGISLELATITNKAGDRVNGAPSYDRC